MADYLKINELKENIIKLIEAKFELTKLTIQEKIEGIITQLIHTILTMFFGFMFVIFLSILAAVGLNIWLKSQYWGFVIITVVFGGLFGIWTFAKDGVKNAIQQIVEKIVDEKLNQEQKKHGDS
ncbi:MAG: phage holin family protein [Spirosomataceae bacterium]